MYVDALVLGSLLRDQFNRTIPIHKIEKPSIDLSLSQTSIVAPETEETTIEKDPATE